MNYEKIQTPWSQKLRELRVRGVPILVFLIVSAIVVYLWGQRVHSPDYMGKVIGKETIITSPERGRWVNFRYSQFDKVEQGDLLGQIVIADTALVNARLDVIRQQISAIREEMDTAINNQRAQIYYEGLRIDLMDKRVSLAETELRLKRARAEFERADKLFRDSLIAKRQYDSTQTEMEVLQVQKRETEMLVRQLQKRIDELEEYKNINSNEQTDPVMAAINIQQKQLAALAQQMKPRAIYAPISGVISTVHQPNGAYIDAGTMLVEIESEQPDHIVGYIRQPFKVTPKLGMEVIVSSRRPGQKSFLSTIESLGGQANLIEEQLQRPGMTTDSGLPVEITFRDTSNIQLRPGEVVDFELLP